MAKDVIAKDVVATCDSNLYGKSCNGKTCNGKTCNGNLEQQSVMSKTQSHECIQDLLCLQQADHISDLASSDFYYSC